MWILLIFTAIVSNLSDRHLIVFSTQIARTFHEYCVRRLDLPELSAQTSQSLVCGKDLPKKEKNIMTKSGLIHAFVVSGGHLWALQAFLVFFSANKLFCDFFLGFYVLISNFQAPVVRAFLQLMLVKKFSSFGFHSTSHLNILFSGIICLSLFPSWSNSISFCLSWLASLALCISNKLSNYKIGKLVWFSLLTLPIFVNLNIFSPFHIIFNFCFLSLIEFILLPISVIIFILPALSSFFNFIFNAFFQSMEILTSHLTMPITTFRVQTWHWLWILFLQFIGHLMTVNLNRNKNPWNSQK